MVGNTQTPWIGPEATLGSGGAAEYTLNPMALRPGIFSDLHTFARHHLASQDIDPVYPVLRRLIADLHLDAEEGLWLTFLYVATYHLPAALVLFHRLPVPYSVPSPSQVADLPTGTERRGFRGAGGQRKMREHLYSYSELAAHQRGGAQEWWQRGWTHIAALNFETVFSRAQTIPHNGRWAAYKWCDLMREVHDWNVGAADLRLRDCTGPKEGLAWLYDVPSDTPVQTLDMLAEDLMAYFRYAGTHLTWEQLETIICDFNSLRKGHYYVGHDIDQMLQQSRQVRERLGSEGAWAHNRVMAARLGALPDAYLGEYHGWWAVDSARKKAYVEQHQIVTRHA